MNLRNEFLLKKIKFLTAMAICLFLFSGPVLCEPIDKIETESTSEIGEWKRVFLASYSRSGNHWLRFLIEEATHIATSSVYRDIDFKDEGRTHMDKIFPWGGYCAENGYEGNCRYPDKDEVVVIKSHFPIFKGKSKKFAQQPYLCAIRIVRHPIDSFYSHYASINKHALANNKKGLSEEKMEKFIFSQHDLESYVESWREFQEHWNTQPSVVTIRYEDILREPHYYLKMILDLAKYEVTDEDITRAVAKYPPKGECMKHLNHYNQRGLQFIETELGSLMNQFNYTINGMY